jgi:predicted HAD superfamily Cof-like phosphohydrolase
MTEDEKILKKYKLEYEYGKEYFTNSVKDFHKAFGAPVIDKPTIAPIARRILRVKLILEELLELAEASAVDIDTPGSFSLGMKDIEFNDNGHMPDLIKIADAITDLLVVVCGAAIEYGIPLKQCFAEVHESNMSKLGKDGKPIYREDGKIMKGPNFKLPDLKSILEKENEQ